VASLEVYKGHRKEISNDVTGSLDIGIFSCLGMPGLCILIAAMRKSWKLFSKQGDQVGQNYACLGKCCLWAIYLKCYDVAQIGNAWVF
jgi:bacteriorhodopsin